MEQTEIGSKPERNSWRFENLRLPPLRWSGAGDDQNQRKKENEMDMNRKREIAWEAKCAQDEREREREAELVESLRLGDLEGARIASAELAAERARGREIGEMLDRIFTPYPNGWESA